MPPNTKITMKPQNSDGPNPSLSAEDESAISDPSPAGDESILAVSGRVVDFPISETAAAAVDGVSVFQNVYNLLPKSIGLEGMKTLKFFGNEFKLFSEIEELGDLECLVVKSPGLDGLPLRKFKGLKELELSRVPPRSAMPILFDVAGIKGLTKLSLCYFGIKLIPASFFCLGNLEYLDLSFNVMEALPDEIGNLSGLVWLSVSNNRLETVPEGLTCLKKLENLDLSNNRLRSLGNVDLLLMPSLKKLNLEFNKLPSDLEVPEWVCCSFDGNDVSTADFGSSSVGVDRKLKMVKFVKWGRMCYLRVKKDEGSKRVLMDVNDSEEGLVSREVGSCSSVSLDSSVGDEGGDKSFENDEASLSQEGAVEQDEATLSEVAKTGSKRKEHDGDLNNSNCKKKPSGSNGKCEPLSVESLEDDITLDGGDKHLVSGEVVSGVVDKCDNCESVAILEAVGEQVETSSSERTSGSKRKKKDSGGDEPHLKRLNMDKLRSDDCTNISQKYSNTSFCGIEDSLQDGFYDGGRDRPFEPLESYEKYFSLESREVIVVDSKTDEVLEDIFKSAKKLVGDLSNELQIAKFLAQFVSNHFRGSDSVADLERRRKGHLDRNIRKPFVCTCSTRNSEPINLSAKPCTEIVEDNDFAHTCEKSLRSIKARQNSIKVPIGAVKYGVCRHRALLLKYLCDRMVPPVPCELVRGYLDFMPHAWNIIPVKRADSNKLGDTIETRWILDACRPNDIREETDPEYYCRYIPMCRIKVPTSGSSPSHTCSLPLPSFHEALTKSGSSLIRCNYGSVEVAAKIRTLEVYETTSGDVRNFEYNCLGEVRMLSALQHPCIVEVYGHQMTSKWGPLVEDRPSSRILQSAIFMEYVNGGSLKSYIEKLSKAGEKHVPVQLALSIARDVASALMELHSKNIIHRDIKSENILIDLDSNTANGTPVVKLCDFDRAVPLRSHLHSCLVAHVGIPPPNVCVGTPRWMAPEVLRTMHEQNIYGLEVDIWSFGCVLFELLTLQIPYLGETEQEMHDLILMGKRPKLTEDLQALLPLTDPPETELDTLTFLSDLFCKCTRENPQSRPTAENLYELLLQHSTQLTNSKGCNSSVEISNIGS